MTNSTANSEEVQTFLDKIEQVRKKVVNIEVVILDDNLYLVCECGNCDARRFGKYLRGGSAKEQYVICNACLRTRPIEEHLKQYNELYAKFKK